MVSTTDADDEVRLAVRAVVDGARRGTRFDRMAVLWPTRRPYARMVEHQLTAAGIPWNGRPGTGTDERMVPRTAGRSARARSPRPSPQRADGAPRRRPCT